MKRILCVVITLVALASGALAETERIFDNAGLFSSDESSVLATKIKDFQKSTAYDFVILTTDDYLGTDNQEATAVTFYKDGDFGFGSKGNGAIVYVDANQRLRCIYVFGDMYDTVTDLDINDAIDSSQKDMTDGRYTDAMLSIISMMQSKCDPD